MHRAANKAAHVGLIKVALGCCLIAAGNIPALAVDLPFSPDCRQFSEIDVKAPYKGIIFRKNPVSRSTQAATAMVFSINGMANIAIPAGDTSCFRVLTGNDSYCFQARNSAEIDNVNAVPSIVGAPACQ